MMLEDRVAALLCTGSGIGCGGAGIMAFKFAVPVHRNPAETTRCG